MSPPRYSIWSWLCRNVTWEEYRLGSRLKRLISDPESGAMFLIFLWSQLEENTVAHKELAAALFEVSEEVDEGNAPQRDLSDPKVRNQILRCLNEHPELVYAFKRVGEMFTSPNRDSKPWQVAEIEHLRLAENTLVAFAALLKQADRLYGSYHVGFGAASDQDASVKLSPVIGIRLDDPAEEVLLLTLPNYADSVRKQKVLTIAQLTSRLTTEVARRGHFRVEATESDSEDTMETGRSLVRVDYPITGTGLDCKRGLFAVVHGRTD